MRGKGTEEASVWQEGVVGNDDSLFALEGDYGATDDHGADDVADGVGFRGDLFG